MASINPINLSFYQSVIADDTLFISVAVGDAVV
jgi:hypothetical protein